MPNGQELTEFEKHVLTQLHELKKAVCALAEAVGIDLDICQEEERGDPTKTGAGPD